MSADLSILPADRQSRADVVRLLGRQFAELEIPAPLERLARAADGVFAAAARGALLLSLLDGRVDVRSRGFGERLLEAALEHAKGAGCRAVDLEVENGHPRAANLYQRAGFVPLDRSRFYRLL